MSGVLSGDFVIAKPIGQAEYNFATLMGLQAHGSLIGTRKRDGHKMIVHIGEGEAVRIYTSGMLEVDHRLDYIRSEIRLLKLAPGTILIGELVIQISDETDPLRLTDCVEWVTSFLGGSTEAAREKLSHGIVPSLVVFNALHVHPISKTLESWPYHRTLRWLQTTLFGGQYVTAVQEVPGPLFHMQDLVRTQGWEGLVLYEAGYQLTWRTDVSSPPRPFGCFKLKPIMEDDFVVFADGRRFLSDGTLKDVLLLQYDPQESRITGHRMISCGRLGAFNAPTRALLSGSGWTHLVLQVRFVRRYAKSGKLREPAFMRVRDDKDFRECVAPQLWPESEFV